MFADSKVHIYESQDVSADDGNEHLGNSFPTGHYVPVPYKQWLSQMSDDPLKYALKHDMNGNQFTKDQQKQLMKDVELPSFYDKYR